MSENSTYNMHLKQAASCEHSVWLASFSEISNNQEFGY